MNFRKDNGSDDAMIRTRIVRRLVCLVGLVFVYGALFGSHAFDIEESNLTDSIVVSDASNGGGGDAGDRDVPFFAGGASVLRDIVPAAELRVHAATSAELASSIGVLHFAPKLSPPRLAG